MISHSAAGYDPSGKPRRIAEGVYSLSQRSGGRVHAFLIDDGKTLTLIDAMWDTDGAPVLRAISEIGRKIADLKNIIVTHAHRSHIGGLAALKKLSGAKVWAHEWESDILAGNREAQRVSPWPKRPLRIYHIQLGLAFGFGKHPPCEVDGFLKEGHSIGPLQVIHTPGHSPGHMGFYWPESRALFAGDAIATWPALSLGWPGLDLNRKQHRQSLLKIDDLRADVICVGHGEPAMGDQIDFLRKLVRSSTD